MVGPLAYLLKNRFYVGDVVYKGEVHKGEHEPILDRELFEAVQAQLAERKVRRKLAKSKSSAILMGLIFDDRGHPMADAPAHREDGVVVIITGVPRQKIAGKPSPVTKECSK
jgi:site-specific DNA recombinase